MAELDGTAEADRLVGTSGEDHIAGGDGNDVIRGDSAADNLLVDGSFETSTIGDNTWSHFASVGGWQSDTGIELWGKDFLGVAATDGDAIMELDFDRGFSQVWQDVTTEAGGVYEFSFDYAMRARTEADTNTIEIWWNDEKIGEVEPDSTDWSTVSYEVIGTGGDDRLEFREGW